jgi:hypothetical protein
MKILNYLKYKKYNTNIYLSIPIIKNDEVYINLSSKINIFYSGIINNTIEKNISFPFISNNNFTSFTINSFTLNQNNIKLKELALRPELIKKNISIFSVYGERDFLNLSNNF